MKLPIFVDPIYNAERSLDFDPATIVEAEEKFHKLPFRAKFPVTRIRLENGERYLLNGHFAAEIKAAQQTAGQPAENA